MYSFWYETQWIKVILLPHSSKNVLIDIINLVVSETIYLWDVVYYKDHGVTSHKSSGMAY